MKACAIAITVAHLSFAFLTILATPQCGPHTKWNNCGRACQETCANINQSVACPAVCTAECSCEEGYIRQFKDGPCILKSECPGSSAPPSCGPLEKWSNCAVSPGCEKYCTNLTTAVACLSVCIAGCSCEVGYIRQFEGGPCILKSECSGPSAPPSCGPLEQWSSCGVSSGCETSCTNINSTVACLSACTAGCFCLEGYIRQFENGPCILSSECPGSFVPPLCGPQEKWNDCSEPIDCERSCANLDRSLDCLIGCTPGCFCEADYVRQFENGPCITESECPRSSGPPSCGPREKWNKCGASPDCETSCANINSTVACLSVCTAGCSCEEGYIRQFQDGPCILKSECPGSSGGDFEICGPLEEWKPCGTPSHCQPTCDTIDNPVECLDRCYPSACSCLPDYVREYENGPCILQVNCP